MKREKINNENVRVLPCLLLVYTSIRVINKNALRFEDYNTWYWYTAYLP